MNCSKKLAAVSGLMPSETYNQEKQPLYKLCLLGGGGGRAQEHMKAVLWARL